MNQINLLHPFTGKAAGVVEESIPNTHSQIHAYVLNKLSSEEEFICNIDYFTSKFRYYNKKKGNLNYRFFPLSYDLKGDFKKFRKQKSSKCFFNYKNNVPEYTIINMSGHSSEFSYQISKLILSKGKKYIAMLGGQHYSDTIRNRKYYQNADHILVHTKYMRDMMLERSLFKNLNIQIFPLGVDTNYFQPKKFFINEKKKIKLLYVGMIVERKRIHISIYIIKDLITAGFNNIHFDIIGPIISQEYLNKLKKLVKKLNLNDKIKFIYQLPYKDLLPYYQNADLFMFPSDRETFGMVIIEAMACGTPVASIDCLGVPAEVIKHNQNGILTSAEDFSTKIIEYFKNPEKQLFLRKNALKTVLRSYTLDITYDVLKKSVNV